MFNINEIIEEYRKGDFEKRLSFFLEYRDIRDAFTEIDQKEYYSGKRKYAGETAKTGNKLCWGLKAFCH
ncbi:MAG: hypothetical protein AB7S75_18330 [Desulfococcaceae bacterium]